MCRAGLSVWGAGLGCRAVPASGPAPGDVLKQQSQEPRRNGGCIAQEVGAHKRPEHGRDWVPDPFAPGRQRVDRPRGPG